MNVQEMKSDHHKKRPRQRAPGMEKLRGRVPAVKAPPPRVKAPGRRHR